MLRIVNSICRQSGRYVCINSNITRSIKTVTVIGCGLMGSGIAQVSAQSGYKVHLIDVDKGLLDNAMNKIKSNLQRVATKKFADKTANEQEKFISDSINLIETSTDSIPAAKKSDIIIEAIIENVSIKNKLFRSLDEVAAPACIFVSNTSSLSISEMAVSTNRQDRFGGLHFFNPVPVMNLVEVISTDKTSKDTTKALMEFVESVGKTAVKCRDTPGFIVNRLLVPYMGEALRMLERGEATCEDIDIAMRLGAGYPMGPLALADYVGLDTVKFILDGWHVKFPDNPLFVPIPMLDKMVAEKKLGQKSGQGFYNYSNKAKKMKL